MIQRLPVTFALAFGAITLSVSIALPAGYISAVNQYSWKDHVATLFAFLGLSIPNFFLGILLIQVLALHFGLLPITGTNIFETPMKAIRILTMPVIALGTALAAQTTRLLRSSMLDAFSQEYVRVARAKGMSQKIVNRYIVFKNALIPVITIVALQFGFLLGGTVVIEEVFALPGLGRLMLTAVSNRDLPVMQATVLFFTLVFVTVNLVADILYAYIDPRIKYGGEEQ
jgi:peptide/nickel transport system permease protein